MSTLFAIADMSFTVVEMKSITFPKTIILAINAIILRNLANH